MKVLELYRHINGNYRGTDDDAPTASVIPDYQLWMDTINRKISEWSSDTKQVWASNFLYNQPIEPGTVATTATTTLTGTDTYFTDYQVGDTITVNGETVRTIATIASDTVLTVTVAFANTTSVNVRFYHGIVLKVGVRTYALPRGLSMPSDEAIILRTDGNDSYYSISKPAERNRFFDEVYIFDINPSYVTFPKNIIAGDIIVGGILKIPGYYSPTTLSLDSDVVPVDDPFWVVHAVSSELAFNDITYSDKSTDLNAKANNLYTLMVQKNRRGTNNNPRTLQTKVQKITFREGQGGAI